MIESNNGCWLLLIHQIPPKPNYLRVKIWRRLQRLGAVAIKNSVYALPKNDQSQEDFQWVLREIIEGGGDGTLCEARLIDGVTDDDIEALFQSARAADYAQIAEATRRIAKTLPVKVKPAETYRLGLEHQIVKLRRRFDEVVAIDFFDPSGREAVSGLISEIESRTRGKKAKPSQTRMDREKLRGKIWVTRKGIHIDRMASAWLVRRFIDEQARRCNDLLIAEIIHDIDLKDAKFKRPETLGIEHLIAGIAMSHKDDEARLARGVAVFNDLYEFFRKKRAK
jgi:hypothetical protein